ncbi:MAG: carboxypeptidase-like regulatory domain-containing protein [Prevotellaceae bacterium]|jgi:hypothetical protein|nr:carboxypeptidase-like regulatory domain-containing protein [Prevotellaceae bacterium]
MKKNRFFGLNVKFALMLVAICGMFAGCYEKEENVTPEQPNTTPPVYQIAGVVYDATTGGALDGVSVNNGQAETSADGSYEMRANVGVNVVTFRKDGYQPVNTSVSIAVAKNGEVVTYNVDAAMYKTDTAPAEPTYKTVKYYIKAIAFDAETSAVITLTNIISNTVTFTNLTPDGEGFITSDEVAPGTYLLNAVADGYHQANIVVNVEAKAAQEGSGEQLEYTVAPFHMEKIAPEPVVVKRYYIAGTVINTNDAVVDGAGVTIEVAAKTYEVTTDANGAFVVEIDGTNITATSLATVTVSKVEYLTQKKSIFVTYLAESGTSISKVEFILKSEPKGGSTDVSVATSGTAQAPAATEDVKDNLATTNPDAAAALEEVGATGDVLPVEVATAISSDLTSNEVVVDPATGDPTTETKPVTDNITVPANTTVYYTTPDETVPTAVDLAITRDIAEEKATASVRVYEGTPSGTVFSKPLEIRFEAPATTNGEDVQLALPLMYEQADGSWKAKEGSYADYDPTTKGFVGAVNHFSKFKFGYEENIAPGNIVDQPVINFAKEAYTGASSAVVTVILSYQGGTAYDGDTPKLATEKQMPGMNNGTQNYVAMLLQNMIKVDNNNIKPNNSYVAMNFSRDYTIPANQQLTGFTLTLKEQKTTYTVTAIGEKKDNYAPIKVQVVVKRIVSQTLTPIYKPGHGKGQGDDLNAGGGIITLE